jgi:hypothetical protein
VDCGSILIDKYLDCFIVGLVVLRRRQLSIMELEKAIAASGVADPPLGAGDAVHAVTFMSSRAWDGAVALVEPGFCIGCELLRSAVLKPLGKPCFYSVCILLRL